MKKTRVKLLFLLILFVSFLVCLEIEIHGQVALALVCFPRMRERDCVGDVPTGDTKRHLLLSRLSMPGN